MSLRTREKSLRRIVDSGPEFRIYFGFLLASVLLSCQGDGLGLTSSGMPLDELGFASQIQPIFDTYCSSCHSPGASGYNNTGGDEENGLDLTAEASYRSLVMQPTFQLPDREPTFRIIPGDPSKSYLVQKMTAVSPKKGFRMPSNGPPFVSQDEIEWIVAWIRAGALDD